MKKASICLLVAALLFCCGLTGFYIGRAQSPDPVIVSRLPATTGSDVSAAVDPTDQTVNPFPVNINSATVEELQLLPGVGPVLAQRIVDYREANGPFETVSQLTLVSGIGIATFEELMDLITVGG